MTCPNCHQTTEDGAAFCGNCGYSLSRAPAAPGPPVPPAQQTATVPPTTTAAASPIAQVMASPQPLPNNTPQFNGPLPAGVPGNPAASIPGYALAKPGQHAGETKALLSLIFGITGLVGALFIALIGLVLGIAGLVLGTMSRSSPKRGVSTAGLVFSSLAILASLAVWTYAVRHDPRFSQNKDNHSVATSATASSDISTPCYSAGLVDKFNISNNADSCDMNAFNGTTLNASTNAYKVYATTSQTVSTQNFTGVFKPALEKDVKDSLPGFTIDSEKQTNFAGSPAYILNASEKSKDVAVVEAAVLHKAGPGENVFILVHAINGSTADLTVLEAQWQWK